MESHRINNEVTIIKDLIGDSLGLLESLQKNIKLSEVFIDGYEIQDEIDMLKCLMDEANDIQITLEQAKSIMGKLINFHTEYYEALPSLKSKEDDHEF